MTGSLETAVSSIHTSVMSVNSGQEKAELRQKGTSQNTKTNKKEKKRAEEI